MGTSGHRLVPRRGVGVFLNHMVEERIAMSFPVPKSSGLGTPFQGEIWTRLSLGRRLTVWRN
jgi:hypothetical protein